jgi:glycosyltransferase involved in cell wall biosynthesis
MMAPAILLVHQGHDLYGSDRTFIQTVRAVIRRWPDAKVTVLLPAPGNLYNVLREIVPDVRVVDLAIVRKSDLRRFRLRTLIDFLKKWTAARRMMTNYDLTYINTAVVLDYLLSSATLNRPAVVHIHEIPTGPSVFVFSFIVWVSRGLLIFNSRATKRAFFCPPWTKSVTVWNGVVAPVIPPLRAPHETLNLLLIGRFNSWKGQQLLLEAVAHLAEIEMERVRIRLVGSVFGRQYHFAEEIARKIQMLGLSHIVEVFPFTPDPSEHYRWSDVVVVPSTKPEPFGLVAIEAMAAGRAVLAARHGGLTEVVVDGVTGILFAPGSAKALAASISAYLSYPAMAVEQGESGRTRFNSEFDAARYEAKIADVVASQLLQIAT